MNTPSETAVAMAGRVNDMSLARVKMTLFRVCFGDRGGLFVFLVSLTVMMLLWRFQVTISDNFTLANGMAALGDGHLHVTEPVYGESLGSPGMKEINGRAYPRNIGQLVVSLPALVVLRAVTTLMDLHVAVAASWSLLILASTVTAGHLINRQATTGVLGSGLGLAAFIGNLLMAKPARVENLALPALQLTSLLLAGCTAVLVYRLCRRTYDRRVGLGAGLATGLATPTLLWATIPKRHVPVAALAVASLYLLYCSRIADTTETYRRYRLLAYAPVGLSAWVFVGAGVTLAVALAIADVTTARENGRRTVAGIGGIVLASLIPFFVTNLLVSGDPLTSPGMLPQYSTPASGQAANSAGSDSSTAIRGATANSRVPVILHQGAYLLEQYYYGLRVVVTEPDRLATVFVRSGWNERVSVDTGGAIELSFIESMPLVGGLVGVPALLVRRLHDGKVPAIHASTLFIVIYAVVTLLFYLRWLPAYGQLTVRYLFVLYPLSVYALVKLPWVRVALRTHGRLLVWTYIGTVLIWGQLLLAWLGVINASFPEAMQALALVGLGTAAILGAWSLTSASGRDSPRLGAIALGLAGSSATILYLIVIVFFYGTNFALPLIQN